MKRLVEFVRYMLHVDWSAEHEEAVVRRAVAHRKHLWAWRDRTR